MKENRLEEALWTIGEPVDMEVFVSGDTIEIKNFKVPESKQGSGDKLGPKVMSEVIQLAQEHEIETIVIHIDWTHRDENGYPDDKDPQNDPSVRFLRQAGFTIQQYNTNMTILGRRRL